MQSIIPRRPCLPTTNSWILYAALHEDTHPLLLHPSFLLPVAPVRFDVLT